MKKSTLIISFMLIAITSILFVGCSKKNAIWLQDGQTLSIVDNTLGEDRENNLRATHSFKNSVVNEDKGYIYVLPVSEENPTVRYFASLKQGISSDLVEITNVTNGKKLEQSDIISDSWSDLWKKGLQFVAGSADNTTHYSNVVTTKRYGYSVSKNNNMTVYGEKYLAVTITSSVISETPISFTIEDKNYYKLPLILTHEGDSWKVN